MSNVGYELTLKERQRQARKRRLRIRRLALERFQKLRELNSILAKASQKSLANPEHLLTFDQVRKIYHAREVEQTFQETLKSASDLTKREKMAIFEKIDQKKNEVQKDL